MDLEQRVEMYFPHKNNWNVERIEYIWNTNISKVQTNLKTHSTLGKTYQIKDIFRTCVKEFIDNLTNKQKTKLIDLKGDINFMPTRVVIRLDFHKGYTLSFSLYYDGQNLSLNVSDYYNSQIDLRYYNYRDFELKTLEIIIKEYFSELNSKLKTRITRKLYERKNRP